jgi:hypothetical protein
MRKDPLSIRVASILIDGWSADPGGKGFGDTLELFTDPDAIPRLWRQHEGWLRQLAAEAGVEPRWGDARDRDPSGRTRGDQYFGEWLLDRQRRGLKAHP